jgi:endoglucanase
MRSLRSRSPVVPRRAATLLALTVVVGLVVGLVVALAIRGPATNAASPAAATTGALPRPVSDAAPIVRVRGNRLVDEAGATLQLRGVNRSGLEYACIQGWGFFDGPASAASVTAIAAWGANVVRLPLNEDCWLGINTPNATYAGANYRAAVKKYVETLHAAKLAVILDLQLVAPGARAATGTLEPMPDADHAPAFWSSVARTFRADKSVLFDLFNEPHDVSWSCWRNGCLLPEGWRAAGMQSLIDTVRSTGAVQPIILGGLSYSNDMSGWRHFVPKDPAGQLAVSFHLYDSTGGCITVSCWNARVAPVAATVPIVTGEFGQTDCGTSFVNRYMPWADAHGISYLGWAWDTWNSCSGPTLITSYDGTPTVLGAALRSHFLARAGTPVPLKPTRLTAKPAAKKGVVLTWGVPTSARKNVKSIYTVYRRQAGIKDIPYAIKQCRSGVCSFTDTRTTLGGTYYYRVALTQNSFRGALSNESAVQAR